MIEASGTPCGEGPFATARELLVAKRGGGLALLRAGREVCGVAVALPPDMGDEAMDEGCAEGAAGAQLHCCWLVGLFLLG